MNDYYSKYYQLSISTSQLVELTSSYGSYCQKEGLLPVYTKNDVLLAIDDKNVDQDMINHFITFSKIILSSQS